MLVCRDTQLSVVRSCTRCIECREACMCNVTATKDVETVTSSSVNDWRLGCGLMAGHLPGMKQGLRFHPQRWRENQRHLPSSAREKNYPGLVVSGILVQGVNSFMIQQPQTLFLCKDNLCWSLSLLLSLCVSTYMIYVVYMHVCFHTCVLAYKDLKLILGVFFDCLLLVYWGRVPHWTQSSPAPSSLVIQLAQRIYRVLRLPGAIMLAWLVYEFWESNSIPQACRQVPLSTEMPQADSSNDIF